MKVAAYCRVSTDADDQINSLENQLHFFNEYIRRNPDWEFVDIYSDEGVTGTNVQKRIGFNTMIQDAKAGKIDLIVTKEVSRFARNTVDTLHYTRDLRGANVGVYFINDNINTLDSDGEFRLSIMASVAQEESRKTSVRVKWGMKRQMERGYVFSPPILGYDVHDGCLSVNEEEAKIVRRIFDLYVHEKMGTYSIARKLAQENTPLYKRIKTWSPTLIMRIIKNEKYAGDLIQQKTIVTDYLSHKSVRNKGEKISFSDHHEPIIDRQTWNEAQRICAERSSDPIEYNPAKHNNRYWCSGKIQCGVCHGTCVTKTKKAQYNTIRIYRCKHTAQFENGIGACTNTSYVDERILIACMQFVLRKLTQEWDDALRDVPGMLSQAKSQSGCADRIRALEEQLSKAEQKKKKLLSLLLDAIITREDYQSSAQDMDREIEQIKAELREQRQKESPVSELSEQLAKIQASMQTYRDQAEPTTHIYSKILRKMVVYPDNHTEVYLEGIPTPFGVRYSRQGRGAQYVVVCEDC